MPNKNFYQKNKYNNIKVEFEGQKFDSKKELLRYRELTILEEQGKIMELKRQVPFVLIDTQRYKGKTYRSCKYYADFTYREPNNEKLVVEDVKGGKATQTTEFIIKEKLLIERYGKEIDFRIY